MSLQPITITDFQTGEQRDKEDFLIMDDAFPELENMYVWRGRLKRRDPATMLGTSGRLRRELSAAATGTIDMSSTPTATYNIFTALGVAATEPNAQIEVGELTNIAVVIQGSGTNTELSISTATQTFTVDVAGTANVSGATIDYATGDITVTHATNDLAAATVTLTLAYYPSLPVMGIFTKNLPAINAEDTVVFDTKYAYRYNNSHNDFNEWISGTTWSGNDANFFMGTNYWQSASDLDLFWVTNFSGTSGDVIRYTDGTTWTTFQPITTGTTKLNQCRFLVPYKGRLLAFNTYEGTSLGVSVQYPQRLRYSQNGSPIDQTNGWLDDTAGRGGYIDCPTNEHIIAYGFIRDQLLIGFERSIWAVRYTGNEILPFTWEKVSSEFGWESMRSTVQFDHGVMGVGKKAISICDGVSTQRADEKIPSKVFNIHNENTGVERVAAARDFDKELVYWTYPSDDTNGTYPDEMLVYSYRTASWAVFKDSYTCFGTWQSFFDLTWADLTDTKWLEANWAWEDRVQQALYPTVIGGNQQGFVMALSSNNASRPPPGSFYNQYAHLYIKSITAGDSVQIESPNHNLSGGDYVKISGIVGTASSINEDGGIITIDDADNFTISGVALVAGTYFGGGVIERFQNFSAVSKNFNSIESGKSLGLSYIDFQVNATKLGEFSCYVYNDYGNQINEGDDSFFNTVVDTTLSEDEDPSSTKHYHRFYCSNHARFSQFQLTFSNDQLGDEDINKSDVQIDLITLWGSLAGRATS